jgi:hypothetical protein
MSSDFWWGVIAATGAWLGVAGSTIVAFSWLVSRTRQE